MRFRREGMQLYVRFETGEEILSSLADLAHREVIEGGFLTGLGAVTDLELGFYELAKKTYIRRRFDGEMEIASAAGIVSRLDGKPHVHLHGAFAGPDFGAVGGHVFAAKAGATAEFLLTISSSRIDRERDERVGLALLKL